MKTFIKNTNQYLLERYPTVWNTKLVWMLVTGLIVHVIFYMFGFLSLLNVKLLHESNVITNFFENGMLFFSIIMTIIIIVIWLTQLLKNNSFKNFYPTSRLKLYGQFIQYFIIILVCSSFYFSYMFGLKHYINFKYDDAKFKTEVKRSNQATVFLSHNLEDYSINNKYYPSPFDSIYCETNKGLIKTSEPYLTFYGNDYQFFTLYTKVAYDEIIYDRGTFSASASVYSKPLDSSSLHYFKNAVLDINDFNYSATPSYLNFSDRLVNLDLKYNDYNYQSNKYYNTNIDYRERQERIIYNKEYFKLLTKNNPETIKALLKDVLSYCDTYKIEHNLTVEAWYSLINTSNFEVNHLIQISKPKKDKYYFEDELTPLEKHVRDITSDYYLASDQLQNVFKNINEIKTHTVLNSSVHIFIWLSFLSALLIYTFRVTSLRLFIFTIISGSILTVLVGLITALFEFTTSGVFLKTKYVFFYLSLILGTLILIIPIFLHNKLRKSLVGICMNITIFAFVFYVLLILSIISEHQSDYCYDPYYVYFENCFVLLRYLDIYISIILLVLGFIFMYLYANIVKRWRALPAS